MSATSFLPLVNRIEELILSGAGNSRTIPTGSFGLDYYYANKSPDLLATDALERPQLRVGIESFREARQSVNEYHDFVIYDVEITIDAAYHLDASELRNNRTTVETRAANDSHMLRKAICMPGNLDQTAAGTPTGAVSGRIEFVSYRITRIDYTKGLLQARTSFMGPVVLTR